MKKESKAPVIMANLLQGIGVLTVTMAIMLAVLKTDYLIECAAVLLGGVFVLGFSEILRVLDRIEKNTRK